MGVSDSPFTPPLIFSCCFIVLPSFPYPPNSKLSQLSRAQWALFCVLFAFSFLCSLNSHSRRAALTVTERVIMIKWRDTMCREGQRKAEQSVQLKQRRQNLFFLPLLSPRPHSSLLHVVQETVNTLIYMHPLSIRESTYLSVKNKPITCPPARQSVQFWIPSATWDVLFP